MLKVPRMRSRLQSKLSPAELALQKKYKVLKEKQALQVRMLLRYYRMEWLLYAYSVLCNVVFCSLFGGRMN